MKEERKRNLMGRNNIVLRLNAKKLKKLKKYKTFSNLTLS